MSEEAHKAVAVSQLGKWKTTTQVTTLLAMGLLSTCPTLACRTASLPAAALDWWQGLLAIYLHALRFLTLDLCPFSCR